MEPPATNRLCRAGAVLAEHRGVCVHWREGESGEDKDARHRSSSRCPSKAAQGAGLELQEQGHGPLSAGPSHSAFLMHISYYHFLLDSVLLEDSCWA